MTTRRSHIKPPKTIGELRRRLPGWTITYRKQLCYEQSNPGAPHGQIRNRRLVMHVVRGTPKGYDSVASVWRGVPYTETRNRSKPMACMAVLLAARAMDMEEDL